MSKEELIAAIRECAGKVRRTPKYSELINLFPAAKMGVIRKHLGTYTQALEESGLTGTGCGFEATMDDLFRDWAGVVRKMGRVPTMTEYEHRSNYSIRPLTGRFRRWKQVPRGMHKYAEQQKLDVEYGDVMNVIAEHYKGEPESAWMFEKKTELVSCGVIALPDRPVYGTPLSPVHLACGPTNEMGVVYLFGMLAGQLGFVVTRIQTEFPDCEAWRRVGEERWQLVRIEFEYESRNFLKHFHKADGCDLIICWKHNWPECPLEVIELKGKLPRLG